MGDTLVVYRQKLVSGIEEAGKHLTRLETAFRTLAERYSFPISDEEFHRLLASDVD